MTDRPPLDCASLSHPGMVRSHNEDSVFVDGDAGIAVLADGMGGYNAGEVASGIAVNVVSSGMLPELRSGRELSKVDIASGLTHAALLLQQQIAAGNKGIYEAAQARPECAGMGTTIVAAVFCGNRVSIGHIGDSRCYRLRGEKFEQLTHDHSLLQEQIDSGLLTPEQAQFSLNKNLVTRALGIEAIVPADIAEYRVEADDIYLLCSDGLTDMVDPDVDPVDRRRRSATTWPRPRRSSSTSPTRTAGATTSRWSWSACRRSSCRRRVGAALAREEEGELDEAGSGQARATSWPTARRSTSRSTASASPSAAAPTTTSACRTPRSAASTRRSSRSSPTRSSRTSAAPTARSSTASRRQAFPARPRPDRHRPAASSSISSTMPRRSRRRGQQSLGRREAARSADAASRCAGGAPRQAPIGLRRAARSVRPSPVAIGRAAAGADGADASGRNSRARRGSRASGRRWRRAGAAPLERMRDVEPALKVMSGAKAGRIVALVKDETLIGRAGVQVVALRRTPDEVRVVPSKARGRPASTACTRRAGGAAARDRRYPGNRRDEARGHRAHEAHFGLMPY